MGTPGMIRVWTPPDKTPQPKSNDKADEPKQLPIAATSTTVTKADAPQQLPIEATSTNVTKPKEIPKATELTAIVKITMDPPSAAHPILPAPTPLQQAHQNIQKPLTASPKQLSFASPGLSQSLTTGIEHSSAIHNTIGF